MKKLVSVLLAAGLVASMTACGGGDKKESAAAPAETTAAAAETTKADEKETEKVTEAVTEAAKDLADAGEISVLYYTYGDTYISSVRSALDAALDKAGIKYQDYDSNNSQTTQTEQVSTAIAKGTSLLVVNLVDSGSDDAAKNIIELAKAQSIPVIFFNRSVSEEVVSAYDKAVFVGTDYEMAGHMQGEMIGEYLVENYDTVDLNGDGQISYVMFKGQEGNAEAEARTQFGVEDADAVLTAAGKPALAFYDANNSAKYLVDQNGSWSAAAATNYMDTILAEYSEANKNMIELVIANNDDMALGAVASLQTAGYNLGEGKTIPVFGVDAIDSAKQAIDEGKMTGTIMQDAVGMAKTITALVGNVQSGAELMNSIDEANGYNVDKNDDGTVKVNKIRVPYGVYTGK